MVLLISVFPVLFAFPSSDLLFEQLSRALDLASFLEHGNSTTGPLSLGPGSPVTLPPSLASRSLSLREGLAVHPLGVAVGLSASLHVKFWRAVNSAHLSGQDGGPSSRTAGMQDPPGEPVGEQVNPRVMVTGTE